MKKAVNTRRLFLGSFILLLTVSLVFSAVMTRSKYASRVSEPGNEELLDFSMTEKLYLHDGSTVTELARQSETIGENTFWFYEVPVSDFDKLSMDILYTGGATTNTRFKFDMIWYKTNTSTGDNDVIFHRYPDFVFNQDEIYNNTKWDGWFYFKNRTTASTTPAPSDTFAELSGNTKTYHVLEAMTATGNSYDLEDPVEAQDIPDKVRIYVTIDSVQFNRVKQVWGMEAFPWENA